MKFENIEQAQQFLNDLENNLKEFEDEHFNLSEEINKSKQDLNSISILQQELRKSNYNLWSQQAIQDQQVEEIQANEPTISDIIGGIDIR